MTVIMLLEQYQSFWRQTEHFFQLAKSPDLQPSGSVTFQLQKTKAKTEFKEIPPDSVQTSKLFPN